jgi:hypothetical protein
MATKDIQNRPVLHRYAHHIMFSPDGMEWRYLGNSVQSNEIRIVHDNEMIEIPVGAKFIKLLNFGKKTTEKKLRTDKDFKAEYSSHPSTL